MNVQLQEIKNMYIKNRLTEGVDFKRYEWLKGDGSAYIILGTITPSVTITLKLDYNIEIEGNYPLGGRIFGNGNKRLMWNSVGNYEEGLEFYYNGNLKVLWNAHRSMSDIYTITITDADIAVNGIKRIYKGIEGDYNNYRLFRHQDSTITRAYSGSIMLFSDGTKKLVPCTLLRSIPATLDANNRARQAGECGMYDSISGKFYGNVASTGTFTVEGDVEPETHSGLQQIYQNKLIEGVDYETADWLKGDGRAYIKGIKYNLWTNKVELKIGKINVTTIENNELVYTNSNGTNWAVQQNPTQTPQLLINFRERGAGVHIEYASMPSQLSLSFYQKEGYAYCLHGDTETKGSILTQSRWDVDLIPTIFSYKMSYIRETLPNGSYRSNLIPCTLLRSIPRNLDAQCKERVAGECGMIDLVSGKFYGNVASSGTFTVENNSE